MIAASEKEKILFSQLCIDDMETYFETDAKGIGIYNEKSLHRILKRFLCDDVSCFEQRVGRYIADIFDRERIIEVQSGSFYPLKEKLKYYLEETPYAVTVVHPVIADKTIINADKESGEIKSMRRSPKRESHWDVLPEMFWLKDIIPSDKLTVRLVFVSAKEYRYSERVRFRRSGAYDSSLVPEGIVGSMELSQIKDYYDYIPTQLRGDKGFSSSEYSSVSKLKGRKLSLALSFLCSVGLLKKEKQGKRWIYFCEMQSK